MSVHSSFILAAYALTALVVLGMLGAILIEHRTLRRALQKFPPREEMEP